MTLRWLGAACASAEARGRRVPHGGGEDGEEAEAAQGCNQAAHCRGQLATAEICGGRRGWCPSHGSEVQVSTTAEGDRGHSRGDSGLDFYMAVVG
jgi:hypothetical protein